MNCSSSVHGILQAETKINWNHLAKKTNQKNPESKQWLKKSEEDRQKFVLLEFYSKWLSLK